MQIKNATNKFVSNTSFIVLHGQEWYEKQKVAGKITAGALSLLESLVKNGTTKTLLELDGIAEEYIRDNKCEPTFKNYRGFPNAVCISYDNDEHFSMVHGVPTNYVPQPGNIIKFDLGATYRGNDSRGAIADSALSVIVSGTTIQKHIDLLKDTRDALLKGITSIKIGQPIGSIGHAIHKHAVEKHYGNIVNYTGHGLSWDLPHARPAVYNKSEVNEGCRAQIGMSIAIEPMFTLSGSTKTWVDDDGWTIHCESRTSHWEHSLFVHKDRVEIMTLREGEVI